MPVAMRLQLLLTMAAVSFTLVHFLLWVLAFIDMKIAHHQKWQKEQQGRSRTQMDIA